jgi:hypothetical protein
MLRREPRYTPGEHSPADAIDFQSRPPPTAFRASEPRPGALPFRTVADTEPHPRVVGQLRLMTTGAAGQRRETVAVLILRTRGQWDFVGFGFWSDAAHGPAYDGAGGAQ